MKRGIKMDPSDDVVTLLEAAECGDIVVIYDTKNEITGELKAIQKIPYGCKMAVRDISEGNLLKKYGAVIGVVLCEIKTGQLVHMHNLRSRKVDMPASAKVEIMKQLGYDMEGNLLSVDGGDQ